MWDEKKKTNNNAILWWLQIRTSLAIGKERVSSVIIGWLAFEKLEGTVECQGKNPWGGGEGCVIKNYVRAFVYIICPFCDPQPLPPFFSKKWRFLHQQKRDRQCLCAKYILQIRLFGTENKLSCRHCIYQHIVAYDTVRYSTTCITHKRKLRIDWKFWNKIMLSVINYVTKTSC